MSPRERVPSLSVSRSRAETTPSIRGYVRYEYDRPTTSSALSRTPPTSAGVSPEYRLQAITTAARELKEKILQQSRRVDSLGDEASGADQGSHRSRVSWRGDHAREEDEQDRHSRFNVRTLFPGKVPADSTGASFKTTSELPGVRLLQDHASHAARYRRENEAARVIQAAYRGHAVRKSLQWSLPAGGTLKDSLRGYRKAGDGKAGE